MLGICYLTGLVVTFILVSVYVWHIAVRDQGNFEDLMVGLCLAFAVSLGWPVALVIGGIGYPLYYGFEKAKERRRT